MEVVKTYLCKGNRILATIKDDDNHLRNKAYPRVLVEEKLGRQLTDTEVVHHIDGNPLNNSLSNLQVLTRNEHARMHSTKYHDTTAICPICGKEFVWTALQQQYFYANLSRVIPKNKNMAKKPFCSKRCGGIYGKQQQEIMKNNKSKT